MVSETGNNGYYTIANLTTAILNMPYNRQAQINLQSTATLITKSLSMNIMPDNLIMYYS